MNNLRVPELLVHCLPPPIIRILHGSGLGGPQNVIFKQAWKRLTGCPVPDEIKTVEAFEIWLLRDAPELVQITDMQFMAKELFDRIPDALSLYPSAWDIQKDVALNPPVVATSTSGTPTTASAPPAEPMPVPTDPLAHRVFEAEIPTLQQGHDGKFYVRHRVMLTITRPQIQWLQEQRLTEVELPIDASLSEIRATLRLLAPRTEDTMITYRPHPNPDAGIPETLRHAAYTLADAADHNVQVDSTLAERLAQHLRYLRAQTIPNVPASLTPNATGPITSEPDPDIDADPEDPDNDADPEENF